MSISESYRYTLVELQCIESRSICNHNCSECPYYAEPRKLKEAMKSNIEMLKAKDPMLYLSDDLAQLKEVLKNVKSKNQET